MLLHLLIAATEPGTGFELPPAEDPVGRWMAFAVAVLIPVSAVIAAKIQAKKNPINGPTPLPVVDSTKTPQLDVGQAYLAQFVTHLTDRVKLTEAKNEDLERKYLELMEKYATTRAELASTNARLEAVTADNVDLRDEVNVLTGQLRGRGNV